MLLSLEIYLQFIKSRIVIPPTPMRGLIDRPAPLILLIFNHRMELLTLIFGDDISSVFPDATWFFLLLGFSRGSVLIEIIVGVLFLYAKEF